MIDWKNTKKNGYPPHGKVVLVDHEFEVQKAAIIQNTADQFEWHLQDLDGSLTIAVALGDITHWSEANRPGKTS